MTVTAPQSVALLPTPPVGVAWSSTGLRILDPTLPFEAYEALVRAAGSFGDAARWILGDLLLFGDQRYGERYAQALEVARVGERSLSRYRYVCERIAPSRRRQNLPFSHHEVVARLAPAEQDQLLERAEAEGLTVAALREAAADLSAPPPRPPASPPARQESLGPVAVVDAARNLSAARQTLERLGEGLEAETAQAVGVPQAIRAIDEVGDTVREALERAEKGGGSDEQLLSASWRVVRQATRSSGFAMIPMEVFEQFEQIVLSR